jgi:hypothetical protein
MVMKTSPFQNPRREPVVPTASRSGYDEKEGSMKEATRLVVGATQTDSSARKKKSGMRTYCLNDRDDRFGMLG